MRKRLFLGACLLALASLSATAQTGESGAVIVQLYYTGIANGHIAITRGEGKTEDIEFKVTNAKRHVAAEAYQRVFAQLVREGYALKSTFRNDDDAVTLVFEKK